MRVSRALFAAASLAFLSGCPDECESIPPSFQLDVRSATGVASIEVAVTLGGEQRVETFNLEGLLDDGETSLVVELDPRTSAEFELDVAVTAYSGADASGGVISTGSRHFTGQPNGCNLFPLDLGSPQPDGGVQDGGPIEDCDPNCNDLACDLACPAGCPSCAMTCGGGASCDATCSGGSSCAIDCAGSSECSVDCAGGSSCEVDCAATLECKAKCVGGASCLLDCQNAIECQFEVCAGAELSCPDGSMVCNRACR